MNFNFRKGKSGVAKTLQNVMKRISTDDTDESLEVENILDDLNHSEEGCSDTCCTANKKSIEDEDFPSYKTVVLDNAPLNSKTFRGKPIIPKLAISSPPASSSSASSHSSRGSSDPPLTAIRTSANVSNENKTNIGNDNTAQIKNGCVTISLVDDVYDERRDSLSRIQTSDCHEKVSVIANENEESQNTKIDSINSSSSRSIQRTKSENTPLFHDSSSGQLVKLDNFSFDSAPNHFHAHSKDVFKRNQQENNQELYTQGDLKQENSEVNDSLKREWKFQDFPPEERNCDTAPSAHSELPTDCIENFGRGAKGIGNQYDNLGEKLDANRPNNFELFDSDATNTKEKSLGAHESQENLSATKGVVGVPKNKQQNHEVITRMISKSIKNYRPFEGSVDVPKSFHENKEDLSNSVISTTASVSISESLSSIALLDSKILAPPDDPDDIFGMGDHWKSSANESKTSLISCMKNNKNDSNKSHSNKEEQTQKITSPHKKSLSFASSSPSQTNNSSFSRNSSEDVVAFKEGAYNPNSSQPKLDPLVLEERLASSRFEPNSLEDESKVNTQCVEKSSLGIQKTDSTSLVEEIGHNEEITHPSQLPSSRRDSITTIQSNTSSVSKIPRYIRNATVSNTSNSNSNVASSVSSPVQRKLLTKQQNQKYIKRGQEPSERNWDFNKNVQGKFGTNSFGNNRMRSNSTSNLSRLSALRKSNQLRIDQPMQGGFDADERIHTSKISDFSPLSPRSSSCGNLSKSVKAFNHFSSRHSSNNDLASSSRIGSRRGSTKYDHVESKVKRYIQDIKENGRRSRAMRRASKTGKGYDRDDFDRSFVLSSGMKSLSMSNLIGENDDGDQTRASSVMSSYYRSAAGSNPNISSSSSNLTRMKAFLSSKQLDQVQISFISKQRIRNSIRGTGSEGELSIRSKYRENLHPEDPGIITNPISTSSPKGSPERSLNVTDGGSVTSRGSKRVDVSKISRLLDHLSYDDDGLCEYDYNTDDNLDDVCFYPVNEEAQLDSDKDDAILEKEDAITIDDVEVEDILQFALEEKRGKQEAVQVLSQLQANYDDVQRKLAEAENKIDKYRFMKPQSKDDMEEENEKSMPTHLQFYSIDDVEPVDTPDGGFAPDYTGKAPQYINEISKSGILQKKPNEYNTRKDLNIMNSDVSALSKKLLDIQEQLYGLDLLALNTSNAFEDMKTINQDNMSLKQDMVKQLREEFKQVLNPAISSTHYSKTELQNFLKPGTTNQLSTSMQDPLEPEENRNRFKNAAELLQLIKEVGRKLELIEFKDDQNNSNVPNVDTISGGTTKNDHENDEECQTDLGSIEKVVNWQKRHISSSEISNVKKTTLEKAASIATPTVLDKRTRHDNIHSSSYGSYPTSPSPKGHSAKQKEIGVKHFNPELGKSVSASSIDSAGFKTSNSSIRNLAKLTTDQFSSFGGGDFDSGCPGSDRSSSRGIKLLDAAKIGADNHDPRNLIQRRKSETFVSEKQRKNTPSKVQLCNVEEEKSQQSGENFYPPKTLQLSINNIAVSRNDKRNNLNIENLAELSSSSLSSEYKCWSPRRETGKTFLQKMVQNESNYQGYANQQKSIPDTLLIPTELERLSVARQCLNSVTDLSTDELSMTGNASGNITGDKDLVNAPQQLETSIHENQQGTMEAPTSELIDTEKSFAASAVSNANTPRKANEGDISLASISLGSNHLQLPSSPSLSTTFTISGLKLSPSMGIGTNSTSNPAYTPRGAIHVQAAQIEQEIDELKTVLKSHREGMMAALDGTPKLAAAQTPRSIGTPSDRISLHNSHIRSEDVLLRDAHGYTCHSTPSKKQNMKYEIYARCRNNSLPSNDKINKRPSSYSYSYDRRSSFDSDFDQGSGTHSILEEKRMEFERRRKQVQLRRKKQEQQQDLYEMAISKMPPSQLTISAISPTIEDQKKSGNISPNFVLGSRVGSGIQKRSTDENEAVSNNILSFFPLDKSNIRDKKVYDESQEEKYRTKETEKVGEMSSGGRMLETYTGEKVFIPALNIESICSATEASGDNFNKDGNLLHDPRLDFSFNETSLEPECTTNANENVSKYDNVTNYHSENERNEKSSTIGTSAAVVTSNCLDSKQLTSSASSSHPATTSSTEPSVVRNIIERGSQLKEKEKFTELQNASCQTNFNLFDIRNDESIVKYLDLSHNIPKSAHNLDKNTTLQPVTKSKRPLLVRSESENLEYRTEIKNHRPVSLTTLINNAADEKQLLQGQSFRKLASDNSVGMPADTVIFIKSCCKKHGGTSKETIKEGRLEDNGEMIYESQEQSVDAIGSTQLTKEYDLSYKNFQHHLKVAANTEELISYKKRQKTKKKHQKSKQKQEMLDLLASLNHANEMASKLKKRSEDILDTLDAEIKEFQKKPILN